MAQTRYKREYCGKVVEYFSRFLELRDDPEDNDAAERHGMVPVVVEDGQAKVQNKPCGGYPSMVKFAKSLNVTTRTLRNWREKYPEFNEACEFADEIQDEVLNERALFGDVDGRVAMKIRELKTNSKKSGEGEGGSGSKLVINLNDDKGAERIEIKKWVGEINEDTEY